MDRGKAEVIMREFFDRNQGKKLEYQMYKPLPTQLDIKISPIHGQGLFATEHIPKNTILGISHVQTDISLFPHGWIRTPLGGFYNHSERPNCKLVDKIINNLNVKLLKTIDDISIDTELTCSYTIWKATPEMRETTKQESWLGL